MNCCGDPTVCGEECLPARAARTVETPSDRVLASWREHAQEGYYRPRGLANPDFIVAWRDYVKDLSAKMLEKGANWG